MATAMRFSAQDLLPETLRLPLLQGLCWPPEPEKAPLEVIQSSPFKLV